MASKQNTPIRLLFEKRQIGKKHSFGSECRHIYHLECASLQICLPPRHRVKFTCLLEGWLAQDQTGESSAGHWRPAESVERLNVDVMVKFIVTLVHQKINFAQSWLREWTYRAKYPTKQLLLPFAVRHETSKRRLKMHRQLDWFSIKGWSISDCWDQIHLITGLYPRH